VTHEHARSRRSPRDYILRKELLASREEGVATARVLDTQVAQPLKVAVVAPRLVQQLVQRDCRQAAGVLRGHLIVSDETLDNLCRCCDPSRACAGRNHLGEGVETHDAAVGIQAQQAGHELTQELLVAGWWWYRLCVGAGVGLHLQEVVGLVLDDEDVVLLAHLVQFLASLHALCCAARVLARGDGIQQMRLASSSGLDIPVRENVIHVPWHQSFRVHLDPEELASEREGSLHGTGERVLLGQNVISTLGEYAVCLFQRHCAPNAHGTLPILVRRAVCDLGVLDHEAQKLGGSSALAVVQTDRQIVRPIAPCSIVFPRLNNDT
jgi:hypothetical protein